MSRHPLAIDPHQYPSPGCAYALAWQQVVTRLFATCWEMNGLRVFRRSPVDIDELPAGVYRLV